MSDMSDTPRLDMERLRRSLAGRTGTAYWRSLEELAGTPEFREFLHREFPAGAAEWDDPAGRRQFLKIMGASLALAGLAGCTRQPEEAIVPYVRQPEEVVPGKPLYYATALTLGGHATGVLVESHLGRPTKIEGNPEHPASLGATDALTQAAVLNLYDPDRAQTVTRLGEIQPYGEFLAALKPAMDAQRLKGGAGLRVLTGNVTSPTVARLMRALLAEMPQARWHQYEPAGLDSARAGARLALGRDVTVRHDLSRADVILALDADFLTTGPGSIPAARAFAARRRPGAHGDQMNRLYAAESTPTNTGGMADHRLPLAASKVEALAREVARALGLSQVAAGAGLDEAQRRWAGIVARDLAAHRGSSLVVAGDGQSPAVHALAHALNRSLGNVGRTALLSDPVEPEPVLHAQSLGELVADMQAGAVDALLILGGNPVYTAPADVDFAGAMAKVALRVHLGHTFDETTALCHWHVPEAHELESWGDARAFDGTASVIQPLIAPLYDGRTPHEILAAAAGRTNASAHELVRETWQGRLGGGDFETAWKRALHDGLIPGTASPPLDVPLRPDWAARLPAPAAEAKGGGLELILAPDPAVHDGRFANNGWLQELPKPLTRLTWENAALMAPATAARLGIASRDEVELELDGRKLLAPAWVLPGHAPDAVTLHLGYGRTRAGRVGNGAGVNAYALRTSSGSWFAAGLTVRPTGRRLTLACTQDHHSMEGRHLVRHADLETYRHEPDFAHHVGHDPKPEMSLFPKAFEYPGHAWGMAIDLAACTGCNACVVACQAENNIPVVGKEQVAGGREMHWIRIDRYFEGGLDNPSLHQQPVMCMHCENAPCEIVCPVGATVHSSEGLNDMVYNRCVGTRYCSNNCPYKVRRFNFFLYQDWNTEPLKLQRNPDVTVRSRGVMEKCTYCVQRINGARIEARKEDRPIRDGEILTACQQSCPTGAIVFGDINDKGSKVAALKADPRNYGILTELNTLPRTTYLASVRNPNPEMEEA